MTASRQRSITTSSYVLGARARVLGGVAAVSLAVMPAAIAKTSPSAAVTTITVRPGSGEHPLSPQIFGGNNNYASDGSGMYDAQSHQVYAKFTEQVTTAGFRAMRFPGGTMANTYHFTRAIGPQSRRTDNVDGVPTDPEPLGNTFGPDEYGAFLDKANLTGDIVVNFATGTPGEAAGFVEYMTAPVGTNPNGGVAWADVRARNGHPAPYNVKYWEVGNELSNSDERYWMSGSASTSCTVQTDCLYANGGMTHFTRQKAVGYADWRESAALSTGAADQTFYIRYAPVVPESQTVYVDGAAWEPVTDLGTAAPGDHVYRIDASQGNIFFGDGTHGAVPPSGAAITVTYDSGPHAGFSGFYSAMKAANPHIKVCSSVFSTEFLNLMGSSRPYDCVVQHEYTAGPASTLGADDYHDQLMLAPDQLGAKLASLRSSIRKAAGPRAAGISTVVTEYGQLGSGHPAGTQHYHLSLDQALFVADMLRNWAQLDVPLAEKAKLTDYVWSPPPPASQNVGFPENAMIAGPGPDTVVEPTAKVVQLMSHMTGSRFADSDISGNPTRTISNGATLPALTTLASRDQAGHLYLIVINRDTGNNVTATINTMQYQHTHSVRVETLNAASFLSYDTPENPNVVQLAQRVQNIDTGAFSYTFPAHSVTAFQLTGK